MVYQLHETIGSRELTWDPPTANHLWVCEGLFNETDVFLQAKTGIPTSFLHPTGTTLYRQDFGIDPVGHCIYNIRVPYGRRKRDVGSYRIECDAMGATIHVKGGVSVAVYPTGSPTHDGLIGVRGDDVEGTDIVMPASKRTVYFTHETAYLTDAKINAIEDCVGFVDNTGMFGRQAYETLFLGFTASQSGDVSTAGTDTTEEIQYHFAISKNLTNFAIGNVSGINKRGWDVAWVKWKRLTSSNRPNNQADYVNIVRVYGEMDLKTALGIG